MWASQAERQQDAPAKCKTVIRRLFCTWRPSEEEKCIYRNTHTLHRKEQELLKEKLQELARPRAEAESKNVYAIMN